MLRNPPGIFFPFPDFLIKGLEEIEQAGKVQVDAAHNVWNMQGSITKVLLSDLFIDAYGYIMKILRPKLLGFSFFSEKFGRCQ